MAISVHCDVVSAEESIFSGPATYVDRRISGNARVVEGGYRVSGRWQFASGHGHAAWMGGHCRVQEPDGSIRLGRDGPVIAVSWGAPLAAIDEQLKYRSRRYFASVGNQPASDDSPFARGLLDVSLPKDDIDRIEAACLARPEFDAARPEVQPDAPRND